MTPKSGRKWKRSATRALTQRKAGTFLKYGKILTASALRPGIGLHRQPPKIYGQIGPLEVRLAQSKSDIRLAQRLRYKVFYEEMSAKPDLHAQMRKRDQDPYDKFCDHLLVFDKDASIDPNGTSIGGRLQVVGTYRVLRQDMETGNRGFYTQSEYDIAPLIAARAPPYRFMELGRSCVLKPYRNKRTVELLWQGLWSYVREHSIDVMIGCASFEGTDPQQHAQALSLLYHQRRAPKSWYVRAHDNLFVDMNLIPENEIDMKAALKALPPLIKGYLRLGAYIGDGAVIDHQFGTIDVLIILPVENIDPRYFEHFGEPNERQRRVASGLPVT